MELKKPSSRILDVVVTKERKEDQKSLRCSGDLWEKKIPLAHFGSQVSVTEDP